jgi:hypothetical protein
LGDRGTPVAESQIPPFQVERDTGASPEGKGSLRKRASEKKGALAGGDYALEPFALGCDCVPDTRQTCVQASFAPGNDSDENGAFLWKAAPLGPYSRNMPRTLCQP